MCCVQVSPALISLNGNRATSPILPWVAPANTSSFIEAPSDFTASNARLYAFLATPSASTIFAPPTTASNIPAMRINGSLKFRCSLLDVNLPTPAAMRSTNGLVHMCADVPTTFTTVVQGPDNKPQPFQYSTHLSNDVALSAPSTNFFCSRNVWFLSSSLAINSTVKSGPNRLR